MNIKARVEKSFRKNGFDVTWRKLRFGYEEAVIECKTEGEFELAYALAKKIPRAKTTAWTCHQGEFEGYVYVMDERDSEELARLLDEEQKRVWNWWERYHVADNETRRKMACGEIE